MQNVDRYDISVVASTRFLPFGIVLMSLEYSLRIIQFTHILDAVNEE